MNRFRVLPHEHGFGARVDNVFLNQPLDPPTLSALRDAWLRYQVLYFPDQALTHPQLESFTQQIGPFGHDPYVKPMEGHENILEVRREPDEQVTPFGASWHSDWSFQAIPPSATLLHAKIVPPVGGDTLFADGFRAYEALDPGLRADIEQMRAQHSARRPYSHEGYQRTGGAKRSMTILPSDAAWEIQQHPMVRCHPESGRKALWINPVYTIGIADVPERESNLLLQKLFAHALAPQFVYRHRWAPDMLTMWDNRSVQHCAQGGYDGHLRVMHRTTVAGDHPR